MSPFKSIGDEPRWRTLYDLLRNTPPGSILTYQQMADALSLDPVRHRPAMASAMRRAAEEYLDVDRRAIEVVRDEGYRVVESNEQLRLARVHNKRAGTQLEIAYSTATRVDLSNVDPEIRKGMELLARGLGEQMEINRRLSARQRRTERVLDVVMQRTDRTEGEMAELHARLAALEARSK